MLAGGRGSRRHPLLLWSLACTARMRRGVCDRRPQRTFLQKTALEISGLDQALGEEGGSGAGGEVGGASSDGCQAAQYIPAPAPWRTRTTTVCWGCRTWTRPFVRGARGTTRQDPAEPEACGLPRAVSTGEAKRVRCALARGSFGAAPEMDRKGQPAPAHAQRPVVVSIRGRRFSQPPAKVTSND